MYYRLNVLLLLGASSLLAATNSNAATRDHDPSILVIVGSTLILLSLCQRWLVRR